MVSPNTVVDGWTLPPEPRRGVRHLGDAAIEKRIVVEVVAVLGQQEFLLETEAAPVADEFPVEPGDDDPDILERLRELGYVE